MQSPLCYDRNSCSAVHARRRVESLTVTCARGWSQQDCVLAVLEKKAYNRVLRTESRARLALVADQLQRVAAVSSWRRSMVLRYVVITNGVTTRCLRVAYAWVTDLTADLRRTDINEATDKTALVTDNGRFESNGQANCRTHRPQKLKCLISLCTNRVSILSVPIQTVR